MRTFGVELKFVDQENILLTDFENTRIALLS